MPEAVIVATARSPIGRAAKGSLVDIRPDDLAAQMVRAALDKVPALDPREIDDLIMGCGQPAGEAGFNVGRAVAVELGYDFLPGTTVNRYCSSSLQTTRMAFHAIKAGEGHAFISAGRGDGFTLPEGHGGRLAGQQEPVVRRREERARIRRPRVPRNGTTPARTACCRTSTSRWARPRRTSCCTPVSAEKTRTTGACAARTAPRRPSRTASSSARSSPVTLPDGSTVSTDDGPRAGTTYEKISQLKPVFRPNGTITAGNACPLNDGAAALVILSDTKARELGLTPLARIVSTGVSGLSPEIMGLGPDRGDDARRSPTPGCRSATWTCTSSTRRSRCRCSVRRRLWAWTRTGSTSRAAQSRWAIRSA